jgi:valyl-tRNA synthetase
MSSTQDVRFSEEKVQQGQALANKLYNATRFVVMRVGTETLALQGPQRRTVEDRWILSRLQAVKADTQTRLAGFEFAKVALGLYDFIYGELCDWYLEIVKPRLYEGEEEVSATLLWVLREVLALAHPAMPFVTEELYSYLGGEAEMLVVHPFPVADPARVDAEAEAEVEGWIELTRRVRRWRDLVGVAVASVLPARVAGAGGQPHELVARLARLSFDGADGEALATIGPLEIVATGDVDAAQVRRRIDERREALRGEVERAERKLANQGFVAKAPAEVVEAEREKLAAYRDELDELGD